MRISDWSSDVCSSDLRAARARGTAGRGHHRGPADGAQPRRADNALRGTTMSIERSQSPTQPDAPRDVGRDKATTPPTAPAPPHNDDDLRRRPKGKRQARQNKRATIREGDAGAGKGDRR